MKKYFVRRSHNSIQLYVFSLDGDSSSATMVGFRVEQGVVERSEASQKMPQTKLEAMLKEGLEHGLEAIDEKAYADALEKSKTLLEERFREQDGQDYKLAKWGELKSSIKPPFLQDPVDYLPTHLRSFLVYKDAVARQADLVIRFDSIAPEVQTSSRNLVFRKSLTIDGNFDAGSNCTTIPQFVYIDGDLVVKNLILSGWIELVVTGNVIASGTVVGYDGESGGRVHVGGHLTAKNMLAGGMFHFDVKGKINGRAYCLSDDDPAIPGAKIIPINLAAKDWSRREKLTPLSDAVFFEEDDFTSEGKVKVHAFNFEQCVEELRQKRSIFRDL